MTLLKNGVRGDAVKDLQTKLGKLGFTLTADSVFGPGTQGAVEEIQSLFGYDVDGIAGDATVKLVDQQVAASFDVTKPESIKTAIDGFGNKTALNRILKPGSEGADVRFLQRRLVALGYTLEVDGKYGPATDKAVRALQGAFKYDVDGSVGPATHKLLNQQIGYGWNQSKAPQTVA